MWVALTHVVIRIKIVKEITEQLNKLINFINLTNPACVPC